MATKTTDTRERILSSAKTLFSIHGCEKATIEDIITAAGITKGAFYHYFKSKESLCEIMIEDLQQQYQRLINSASDTAQPIDKLAELAEKILQLNSSAQWINCRLLFRLSIENHTEHPNIQQKLQRFWGWYKGQWTDLIEQCRQAGQIRNDMSVNRQLGLLLSFLTGQVILSAIDAETAVDAELLDNIIGVISAK